MPKTKFSLNNLRLFIKMVAITWVPIFIQLGWFGFDGLSLEGGTSLVAASGLTIDGLFRIWQIGDDTP